MLLFFAYVNEVTSQKFVKFNIPHETILVKIVFSDLNKYYYEKIANHT